ncbi:VOC family protein [Hirschia maritima]|uniref:VOC family protein n=1 Tax=Hirschia maritima TaxID=1121961 RepID=UPI0004761B36|nr:VOC family protein [Hirschia maritima]
MISYSMIGVSNFDKASKFYDEIFSLLGAQPVHKTDRSCFYATQDGRPLFAICIPYNKEAATAGNGSMTAFTASSKDIVKAVYDKAIELGATCEGEPGPRGEFGDFAYFRDMDGNKLAISALNQNA